MKNNTIKWNAKALHIPAGATNFALSQNGAKATASTCGTGFHADGVINGNTLLKNWGSGNGWQSAPVLWHPNWWGEWVQVDFPVKTEIDTVIVYNYPQMILQRPWANLLNFQVQYLNDQHEWISVFNVTHNVEDINVIEFKKAAALSIRVWVNRNHFREESGFESGVSTADEAPKILEVEAYCLNGISVYDTVLKQKELVAGSRGRAAIFYDETFEQTTAVDIKKLSKWLDSWGYGVNFLLADDLCAKELFCAENFTLFVHPYGKYVPIGTNLYDYLMQGGNLLTFGGRAFTAAKQKGSDGWINIDIDPAITVSKARYVDHFRPYREQLGIFSVPGSQLERVNKVITSTNQSITKQVMDIEQQVEGWMAIATVGELQPIDETRRYVKEGRIPEINHLAREGINRNKADTPLLWGNAIDENYASIFGYPCSRWVPILDCLDSAGRNRGPVLSLMPHYEGMYRGSSWIFCGAENVDVLQWENMENILHDAIDYIWTGVVAHSLEASYSCYRAGETLKFSVIVDNCLDISSKAQFHTEVCGCAEQDGTVFVKDEFITLQANGWERLDFRCDEVTLSDSFYKITTTVLVDGKVIDQLETGFVVWNERVLQEGPKVTFEDNFFHFDGKARYVIGSRDSGLHMPWQPEQNALGWDKMYGMLRDYGMQVTSPVHLDWCFPGLGWGEFDENQPIPEIILRRMDAQAQLAQKNHLIYAPCLFFVYEKVAMQRPDISKRICEVLGKRYKNVPGIMFYIFDDGCRHDPAKFNAWAKECSDGFKASGRDYLITAEITFRQIWPDAMRRSAKHLSFSTGSNFQHGVGDPVYERLIDLRPIGKSFTLGEFVRRIPTGTPEDFHGYLAPVHVNFGMGYAMSLNWKWSTPYHTIWPSDVVFPGNHVPKKILYAYRNEALFFRFFEPVYESPPLMIVMPSNYWLKNCEPFTRYMVKLIRRLLELKVDFACIDEEDIALLPANTRGLILPMPLEFTKDVYNHIKNFTQDGGKAFVIGDLGELLEDSEGEGSKDWLLEFCGILRSEENQNSKCKSRSTYMDTFMQHNKVVIDGDNYEALSWIEFESDRAEVEVANEHNIPVVTRTNFGKGTVWFMNDLGTNFPPKFMQNFFAQANIDRMKISPKSPTLHCFKTVTADGPVFTLFPFPWDQSLQHIKVEIDNSEFSTVLKEQAMGVIAVTSDGKGIFALESQGDVTFNGHNVISSTAHSMLLALDKKDISSASSLLLLPIGTGEVTIPTDCNVIECGEIVGGKWKAYETIHVNKTGGITIKIDGDSLSKLFLLFSDENRENAVRLLETSML